MFFSFGVVHAIYNIHIGILSFCGIIITDEICHMAFDCVTLYLDIMTPLYLGHILRVDLTIPIVAFCSSVRKLPSFM